LNGLSSLIGLRRGIREIEESIPKLLQSCQGGLTDTLRTLVKYGYGGVDDVDLKLR
jgi:hypothetical protein